MHLQERFASARSIQPDPRQTSGAFEQGIPWGRGRCIAASFFLSQLLDFETIPRMSNPAQHCESD
jgi:hypothetical protein